MVFQNMERYLEILKSKEDISAEQVLGGFQELCKDVTRAGQNVAYHDVRDVPAFLELLFWTGNLYCRLYEKKKEQLSGYDEAEDVGELHREIQENQELLRGIGERVQSVRGERERLAREVKEAEDGARELSLETERLKSRNAVLKAQIEEEERRKREAGEETRALRAQFEQYKQEALMALDDAESLRKSNEKFRNGELAKAREELEGAEAERAVQEKEFQELNAGRAAQTEKLREWKARKEELESQIASGEFGRDQIKKRLERLEAAYKGLSEENEERARRAEDLAARCLELEGRKAELESQNQSAEAETENLQDEIRRREEKNRGLLAILEKSRGEEKRLKDETKRHEDEIRSLQKKLDDLDSERENLQMEQEKMNERLEDLNRSFDPAIRKEVEQRLKKTKDKEAFFTKQLEGIRKVVAVIAPRIQTAGDFGDMDKIRQALSEIDKSIDELANGIRLYEKIIEESLT